MANAYKNKVIYNGNTLIDISDTTAVASDVNSGKYLYLADGSKVQGTQSVHSITETLTRISSTNAANKVINNGQLYCTLTPEEGYSISSVTVTMGGVDITSQVFTGDDGTVQGFSLTTNLTHCIITDVSQTASSFYAELEAESGYRNLQVTITMGGFDMSNYYSSGVINIPNVTGDIVITAVATSATVSSISAVFSQGDNVIYDTDSLDDLKQYLTVTALYEDSTSAIVSGYTLSGTLAEGSSTITVTYGSKTTTFAVTVSALPSGYTKYDYIKNLTTGSNNASVSTGLDYTYGSENYEHELEFMLVSGSTTAGGIWGLRATTGTASNSLTAWVKGSLTENNLAVNAAESDTSYTLTASKTSVNNLKVTHDDGYTKVYFNDDLVIDAADVTFTVSSSNYFHLFKAQTVSNNNSGYSTAVVRIYGYNVKNLTTGEYVARLVPCTNASGQAGFYDIVRGAFYTVNDGQYLEAGNA